MNDQTPHQPASQPTPIDEPVLLTQPPPPVVVSPPQPVEHQRSAPPEPAKPHPPQQLRIYSHSPFFYWWPVWVMGYVMALLTYWQGQQHQIGQDRELFHASSNLGVVYFLTLFLVILITNFTLRGMASGMVIMGGASSPYSSPTWAGGTRSSACSATSRST